MQVEGLLSVFVIHLTCCLLAVYPACLMSKLLQRSAVEGCDASTTPHNKILPIKQAGYTALQVE